MDPLTYPSVKSLEYLDPKDVLETAVEHGEYDVCAYILDNYRISRVTGGMSDLCTLAAGKGHTAVLLLLFNMGFDSRGAAANIEHRASLFLRCFGIACSRGYEDMIQCLCEISPLFKVIQMEINEELVRLAECGRYYLIGDERDNFWCRMRQHDPLMIACKHRQIEMVQYLLGLEPYIKMYNSNPKKYAIAVLEGKSDSPSEERALSTLMKLLFCNGLVEHISSSAYLCGLVASDTDLYNMIVVLMTDPPHMSFFLGAAEHGNMDLVKMYTDKYKDNIQSMREGAILALNAGHGEIFKHIYYLLPSGEGASATSTGHCSPGKDIVEIAKMSTQKLDHITCSIMSELSPVLRRKYILQSIKEDRYDVFSSLTRVSGDISDDMYISLATLGKTGRLFMMKYLLSIAVPPPAILSKCLFISSRIRMDKEMSRVLISHGAVLFYKR
jgi:hypothetical protein